MVLVKPNSIKPTPSFEGEVVPCSKKEKAGRHTPFFAGYRPACFYIRTTDVTAADHGLSPADDGTNVEDSGDAG